MKAYAHFAIKLLHIIHAIVLLILGPGPLMAFNWCPIWIKIIQPTVLIATITGQILFLSCPIVTLQTAIKRKYIDPDEELFSFTGALIERWLGVTINPLPITIGLLLILSVATFVSYKINIFI